MSDRSFSILTSNFKPAWWLSNPHLQTLWSTFFRRKPKLQSQRERFELPDGDFLDLDWVGDGVGPIVLVLHGLGGSINSPYAHGILHTIKQLGWRGVLMHFRGCSGEPNRLPRYYHSGETSDVAIFMAELLKRYPHTPIAAVGYSLGGNVLLKWLGETRQENPLRAAVAVSVPFELRIAATRVNQGFSRVYQWSLLRDMRRAVERKAKIMSSPVTLEELVTLRNFPAFDNKITAPLHGFKDAFDYYDKASSKQFLKTIAVPTLILHALDDPLFTHQLKFEIGELSPHLILELSQYGGHVGFISGNLPFWPEYWLEKRIPEYLVEVLSK